MKKIIFKNRYDYVNDRPEHYPSPTSKNIPKWFLKKSKYKEENGQVLIAHGEKQRSWKACPAINDGFVSGYVFKTPCDILIRKHEGSYSVLTEKGFEPFCGVRGKEEGFPTPPGYSDIHLYWISPWIANVPKGYTALFLHPLNRNDLPFLTIPGFIDCEEFSLPGRNPFFIKEGFEGFIPAGTPYVQIIPFKQEEWEMEIKVNTKKEIEMMKDLEEERFISETRTDYKKKYWVRKKYE